MGAEEIDTICYDINHENMFALVNSTLKIVCLNMDFGVIKLQKKDSIVLWRKYGEFVFYMYYAGNL